MSHHQEVTTAAQGQLGPKIFEMVYGHQNGVLRFAKDNPQKRIFMGVVIELDDSAIALVVNIKSEPLTFFGIAAPYRKP